MRRRDPRKKLLGNGDVEAVGSGLQVCFFNSMCIAFIPCTENVLYTDGTEVCPQNAQYFRVA